MMDTGLSGAPATGGGMNIVTVWAARLLYLLRSVISAIVIVLFVIMTMATIIQVAGRYVFGFSIAWTTEIATYSQIWIVFLASGVAMRYGMHIGVDVLATKLPPILQRALAAVMGIVSCVFLWIIFDGSLAIVSMGHFQTAPLLRIEMSNIYLAIPIGIAYLTLEYLIVIVRLMRGREPFEKHAVEDFTS